MKNCFLQIIKIFCSDLKENYTVKIIQCCAVTGEGLENFFGEVLSAIQSSKRGDK